MKKCLLILIVLLTAIQSVSAQASDTIYGRSPDYYYMDWYDECEKFHQPYTDTPGERVCLYEIMATNDVPSFIGRYQNTQRPLLVRGLSLMQSIDYSNDCGSSDIIPMGENRLPEYLYLYLHDTLRDTLLLVDSLRWDTVAPKIMKLPRNSDTSAGYLYCEAYEVMFKESYVINGSFFIAGSSYSNRFRWSNPLGFYNKRTWYVGIGMRYDPCRYSPIEPYAYGKIHANDPWVSLPKQGYGPFHLILVTDSSILEVEASDEAMGSVTGAGIYHDSTTVYIRAVPYEGYRFIQWNDGDRTNPRAVYLTQDTLFTALFEPRRVCEVVAVSNDDARGSVYGGGRYYEDDTATLTARAWGAYQFVRWDDGITDNPRRVVVTQDSLFKAIFLNPADIEEPQETMCHMQIVPNPTEGTVTVILATPPTSDVKLVLHDVSGHEVLSTTIPAGQDTVRLTLDHLPSGTYYATLYLPDGTTSQKVVRK